MKYLCDKNRHLICIPYTEENLHAMAAELDIKRCWYHKKPYPHYDIPKRRKNEIESLCQLINSKNLVKIIKGYKNEMG